MITACLVILAISMAVMAVSSVMNILRTGWSNYYAVNLIPFLGMATVVIAILSYDNKADGKRRGIRR